MPTAKKHKKISELTLNMTVDGLREKDPVETTAPVLLLEIVKVSPFPQPPPTNRLNRAKSTSILDIPPSLEQ